jgi:hypothetical protein
MSTGKRPRRIGEILADLGYGNAGPGGSRASASEGATAERTVVLGYRAPVWVTVDLDARAVSKVEVGDTEVAPERNEEGFVVVVDSSDAASPGDEEDAAQIAEGSMWPAWGWAR